MKAAHLASSLAKYNVAGRVAERSVSVTPQRANRLAVGRNIQMLAGLGAFAEGSWRNIVDCLIVKRLAMALMGLCLGLALASCSGFSDAVADHWPHWAGGMPDDVPPRPGAPGYEEFIAHKQSDIDAAKAASSGGKTNPQAVVSGNPPPGNLPAVEGGLY
jgi:hypothetical protein